MYNPIATYRLQFHKEFTFKDFEAVIGYLKMLGVSTIYASPVLEAVPGSNHGYDGTNPLLVNGEIGTPEQLRQLSKALKESGMGWIQDIVPNHMAFHPKNQWLMDVLEKGRHSVYASFFDIHWESPLYEGKLMVPFLGDGLEKLIGSGELEIDFTDRFVFRYYDSAYPLNHKSYVRILSVLEQKDQAIDDLLKQLTELHRVEDAETYAQEWHEFLLQLQSLMKNGQSSGIRRCLELINNNKDLLRELAAGQEYQLCHWAETDRHINYRRFFTVNSLICLNIQDENVFNRYHQLIKTMVEDNVFQGLRIDHVDGLFDPAGYLQRLRGMVGDDCYITVEKILKQGEKLDHEWPVQGNTGYDFLALVNNLLTDKASERSFTDFYHALVGSDASIQSQIYEKKRNILYQNMGGELANLTVLFRELHPESSSGPLPEEDIKKAIGDFLIHCPVYRFYGNEYPLKRSEKEAVVGIIDQMRSQNENLPEVLDLLEGCLLGDDGKENADALRFYQRMMQFSGPLMAKGVEDTLMYTYNRFIGHNEVGDSPEAFGLSFEEFHQKMIKRHQESPLSLNATSTHDTKRGEDVRARLNVLTNLPGKWQEKVGEWRELNADLKQNERPDVNDEYFIYQSLLGAYPMPGQSADSFEERFLAYLEKALREAKLHSGWTNPDSAYEEATKTFAAALLDERKPFWPSFRSFHRQVADFGIVNSLAQVVLKFTCPGVPDVYQGCEQWDLSFVDPDNRRPIDFLAHEKWLHDVENKATFNELWAQRFDGRVKIKLTQLLFRLRREFVALFTDGLYLPLRVDGRFSENVFAFARRYEDQWIVVAVPLHLASVAESMDTIDWADTAVLLPPEAPGNWQDVISRTDFSASHGRLVLRDLDSELPLVLLKSTRGGTSRSAGILLSITSLPSSYGIGDLGPEAYSFADFLARGKQKFWQLLPLNPTDEKQMYSPYSSVSSMAGNTLLISPELLVEEGLLQKEDCDPYQLPAGGKVQYHKAREAREKLLSLAWTRFQSGGFLNLKRKFRKFCEREGYWLEDFVMYVKLKAKLENQPWYNWPKEFKERDEQHIRNFSMEQEGELDKERFLQFLFYWQWSALRAYCRQRGVRMLGDLPFYVSYDSVDVWANREIFSLDDEGNMLGVAGVPPDYFNEDGQLWGMPVFRWDVLKEQNYGWWLRRLRKNLELYDLVRLDHFRAFSAYWEVAAGEQTAKNGTWKPGPGGSFFETVRRELGKLPFLAEDLGDIDSPVYELRDEFALPGMKVLQFAFGQDMAVSMNTPHNFSANFFVYTGTHDNNTSVGWFRTEATKANLENIALYTGVEPTAENVHLLFSRLAYSSVAKTVILPMQDLLGLGETARINTPAETQNNWYWALPNGDIPGELEQRLREWVRVFNR